VRQLLGPPGRPGTNRHKSGTDSAQTRVTVVGIVSREGGGAAIPTLGGGYRLSRCAGPAGGGAAS
jgi:hypothetical protein